MIIIIVVVVIIKKRQKELEKKDKWKKIEENRGKKG